MAIMADVMRASILGTGPGGEIFDVSFWVFAGAPTTATQANTIATGIRDAWQANAAANWKSMILPDTSYREIRLYSYPTGGPNASVIGSAPIVNGVGTGTGFAPLQQCMVASLRTLFAGRRSRGRMFIPASGQSANTGHLFAPAAATACANATGAFLTAVNAINTIGNVAVISQVGAGLATSVTEVRVDDKPDMQRRRANKLQPATTATAAVA